MSSIFFLRLQKVFSSAQYKISRSALFNRRVLGAFEHSPVLGLGFDTVVDVGANRGQFAIAARSLLPQSSIMCFEPLPEPASVLSEIFSADQRFVLYRHALGDATGVAKINISKKDDSSSILKIGELQTSLFPGTDLVRQIEISVKRLDQCVRLEDLSGRAILKIDTQGYELPVLLGAEKVIGGFYAVYCECSFLELYEGQALADKVISCLDGYGFSLSGVYNPSYTGEGVCAQADLLFIRRT